MHDNLIERYLTDMLEVRGTRSNAPETSFYPALEHLLTSLGKTLNPNRRGQVYNVRLKDRVTVTDEKGKMLSQYFDYLLVQPVFSAPGS